MQRNFGAHTRLTSLDSFAHAHAYMSMYINKNVSRAVLDVGGVGTLSKWTVFHLPK